MATLPAVLETPMGSVSARLTITNSSDFDRSQDGEIDEVGVRSVTIDDVLVDTGATLLCLPSDVIASLGLRMLDEVPIETAKGPGTARLFRNALLDVAGRRATVDVLELPAGTTPLLGVTPME